MSHRSFRARAFTATAALLGGLAACVPEFADDQSVIRAPRIVAVRSVPAEARAGTVVQLSALVVGPSRESALREEPEWAMCLARKPLTELGPMAQECIDRFGSGGETVLRIGRGTGVSGAVPADACQRFGPLTAAAEPGGVSARPVDSDLSGGYHQPVVVGSEAGVVLASVRLTCGIVGLPSAEVARYTRGYRPNENPVIDRLDLGTGDGARAITPGTERPGATVRAGARVDLRALWAACPRQPVCGDGLCTAGENQSSCAEDCRTNPRACTGAETYLSANADTKTIEERREGMAVAWYATAGVFAEEKTGRTEGDPDGVDTTNGWTAPLAPGLVNLWVVVRDDRGGVGWGEYLVSVEP